jgi:hypothetical protein
VTIDEVKTCIAIFLGEEPLDECPECDYNGDGEVTFDEVLAALDDLMNGCVWHSPTPTPTGTRTGTPTRTKRPTDTPTHTPTIVRPFAVSGGGCAVDPHGRESDNGWVLFLATGLVFVCRHIRRRSVG